MVTAAFRAKCREFNTGSDTLSDRPLDRSPPKGASTSASGLTPGRRLSAAIFRASAKAEDLPE